MDSEQEFRVRIVAEAMTWTGTPYMPNGAMKGIGSSCANFLFAVARNAGVLPDGTKEPDWYTAQFATHSNEERLIANLLAYGCREITEREVKPADVVVFRAGRSHGHAALILEWPTIIHVLPPSGCHMGNAYEGRLKAFHKRFFTLWRG